MQGLGGESPARPSIDGSPSPSMSGAAARQDRIEICDHDLPVEFDQVIKDQLTPAVSAREPAAHLPKARQFDRQETVILRKRTNQADVVAESRGASISSMSWFATHWGVDLKSVL